jgi:hypothetical protein
MRKRIMIGMLVLLSTVFLGAPLLSCSKLECGNGTHEENGKCVSNSDNWCGPGTVSQGGSCVVVPNPCGPNTTYEGDGGICVGTGGGTVGDAGVQMRGARWYQFLMQKPESIATLANIQLPGYFKDGTIVVILRTEPGIPGASVALHGGDGLKINDDPLTYTFREGFIPETVSATIGTPYTGTDGLTYTPFETSSQFDWTFKFLPDQPPLYIYNATISGNLNPDALPTSTDPPLSGTFSGCFTPRANGDKYGAEDVYLEVLSQNLLQLIQGSGGQMDAECTPNGGVPNGYLLQAKWDASEILELTPETPATDGGVEDDAGVSDAAATD